MSRLILAATAVLLAAASPAMAWTTVSPYAASASQLNARDPDEAGPAIVGQKNEARSRGWAAGAWVDPGSRPMSLVIVDSASVSPALGFDIGGAASTARTGARPDSADREVFSNH